MRPAPTGLPRIRDCAAVVFDLDGVLVDSEPVHFRASNRVLGRYDATITEAEYRRFIGWGETATWNDWRQRFALPASIAELTSEVRQAFQEELARGIPVIAPAVELVHRLHRDGVPLALASSSPRERIDAELQVAGLLGTFPLRVSGEDAHIAHPKPAPDVYLHAAEILGVDPRDCIAIEDSGTGALAASRAGMTVVAVPTPWTADQDFSMADVVLDSLQYFPLLFLGW